MEAVSISSMSAIWRVFSWLPKYVLQRIFSKQRLAELILIDVRPRHEYATVNLGEVASYKLWLQAINLSPFDVELDRAEVRFHCGGTTQKSSILKKVTIRSGERKDFFIDEPLNDGHANQIVRHLKNHQSAIEMDVEFNCALHDFCKSTGRLEGVRPEFLNEVARAPKAPA